MDDEYVLAEILEATTRNIILNILSCVRVAGIIRVCHE